VVWATVVDDGAAAARQEMMMACSMYHGIHHLKHCSRLDAQPFAVDSPRHAQGNFPVPKSFSHAQICWKGSEVKDRQSYLK
jgi:hypothetical protein